MEQKLKIALPGGKWKVDNYLRAMRALGAEPVPVDQGCCPEGLDGLLLPGGYDIDPMYYGQEVAGSEDIDREMDELQFAVLDRFVKAGKPVFGICRGQQIINVYFGGSLIQHLNTSFRHSWEGDEQDKVHDSRAEADCWLARLYGTRFPVNSAHHQAVDRPGRGIRPAQWAEDGVVEAIYHESLPVYSVQWHPERMCFDRARRDTVDGSLVLRDFLALCQKRRAGGAYSPSTARQPG